MIPQPLTFFVLIVMTFCAANACQAQEDEQLPYYHGGANGAISIEDTSEFQPLNNETTASYQEPVSQDAFPRAGGFPKTNYIDTPQRPPASTSDQPTDNFEPRTQRQDDRASIGRVEDGKLYLQNCTVMFIEDIELPARESGQIVRLDVREGDPVKARQLLAQIDDTIFRLEERKAQIAYENARIKAEDRSNILAAQKEEELATVNLRRATRLNSSGSMPDEQLEKAQFEYQLSILKVKVAKNNQLAALGEAKIEKAKIDEVKERILRHQMFIDFDGYVVELLKHKSEWVNAGDSVMRVGRMDRLAVQAIFSSKIINAFQIRNGQPVVVTLTMAGGQTEQLKGKISTVLLEMQSGTIVRIRAEVENQRVGNDGWLLQPASVVDMVVDID